MSPVWPTLLGLSASRRAVENHGIMESWNSLACKGSSRPSCFTLLLAQVAPSSIQHGKLPGMGQSQVLWTSCARGPGDHRGWLKLQAMNPTHRTSPLKRRTLKKINSLGLFSEWVFWPCFPSLKYIPAEDLTWSIEENQLQHQKRSP